MQPGLKNVAADIRGLEAAIVTVIPDNLLYDAWSRDDRVQDADEAATYFGDLVRIHFGALQSVGVARGDIQLTIESGDAIILVRNIRGNYVITLVFQSNVPLGLMRVHTDKLIQHVAATLPAFDDDGALPFAPKEAPVSVGFEALSLDADDADDADDAQPSAPTQAPQDDAPQAEDEAPSAPEEAPTYYGYVYARDRDRLEAERAAADAKRRAELAEGGHYAEEDEAQARDTQTAPVDALQMDAEGGTFPVESLHTDTTPSTTEQERQLLLAQQEHQMANEGGIPLPLSKPAIQEVREATGRHDIQVLPRHPELDDDPNDDLATLEAKREQRRLLLAQQEHQMANEGGIPLPLSKPAIQEIREVTGRHDIQVLPRHPELEDDPNDDAATLEAKREQRRLMLAEQEHRMTSEGGVPLPLSKGAIQEARDVTGRHDIQVLHADREALSAARRHDIDASAPQGRPQELTPLEALTDADTFAADSFAADGFTAVPAPAEAASAPQQPTAPQEPAAPRAPRTRAEAIILYVTANSATPQNVGARLAVHSRISLDEIKTPEHLDNEQTERLEDAAKAILGVSELPI